MLAVEAVKVVDENVGQDEAVLLLGHALKIKAERKTRFSFSFCKYFNIISAYLKDPVEAPKSNSDWLIASVALAILVALLLIWVLCFMYKQYWVSCAIKYTAKFRNVKLLKYFLIGS